MRQRARHHRRHRDARRRRPAADAVVAADAVLGVVQPMSTGLGGDATCIVRPRRLDRGVPGNGAAGAGWTPDRWSTPARSTPTTRPLPSCPASSTHGPICSARHGRLGAAGAATGDPPRRRRCTGDAGGGRRVGTLRQGAPPRRRLRGVPSQRPDTSAVRPVRQPALRSSLERIAAGGSGVLPRRHRRVDRPARSRPPAVCCPSMTSPRIRVRPADR